MFGAGSLLTHLFFDNEFFWRGDPSCYHRGSASIGIAGERSIDYTTTLTSIPGAQTKVLGKFPRLVTSIK